MQTTTASGPSLRWKLTWQLSLVFTAVVAIVVIGLCVYGAMILSPTIGLQDRLGVVLQDALEQDANGALLVRESPALKAFKAENDKLWFVISTQDGMTASYGVVPTPYIQLSPFVRFFRDADLRGAKGAEDVASIDQIDTAFGEVRAMYGGNTSKGSTFLIMLAKTYPIYLPLLAIALPAVFFTVPRLVRNAMSGLNSVVSRAPDIDPKISGSRLPVEEVPREVAPLIVAFNGVLERLEEQFHVRQRFLIDAAHELRTPIAIMQTRIESMSRSDERERLIADVARLGDTAEQLLEFERNGHASEELEPVDLVDIARSVVADLAPIAIAAGYDIGFESNTETQKRMGNGLALQRAINNLVRNAIDHGGNRGAISVLVSPRGEISVCDEGPGIPETEREQVFEPFYRLTPRSTGAGLGLSLVRQIVDNHRGCVTVDSTPFRTIFTIRL